eukprot:PITA_35045
MVSKDGIQLDPIKFQAILDFPPPLNLLQLQRLQGKENFLRRFIPNYAELAKGFARLLKKWVPFHWDQVAQASFDALRYSMIRASLMYAPNYQKDYYLYLSIADTTIGIVLVQEESGIEHPIYYLNRNLNNIEKTPVTPTIFGTSVPKEEVSQLPEDISIDLSETVTENFQQEVDPQLEISQQESTSELELVQPKVNLESIPVQIEVTSKPEVV